MASKNTKREPKTNKPKLSIKEKRAAKKAKKAAASGTPIIPPSAPKPPR